MARLIHGGSWVMALAASGAHKQAGAEDECVAQPERQPGDKRDFDHIGNAQAPGGVDAKPDGSGGEDRRAKIVPDGVADEACHRGDPIRHLAAADRAQREVVVKRQGDIACCDKSAGNKDLIRATSAATRRRPCRFRCLATGGTMSEAANATITRPSGRAELVPAVASLKGPCEGPNPLAHGPPLKSIARRWIFGNAQSHPVATLLLQSATLGVKPGRIAVTRLRHELAIVVATNSTIGSDQRRQVASCGY